jgi:flagellar biosynthetic protein FlhB
MAEQDGDKTQDPTPHRRQQAREQGQVAKSQDLGSALMLLTALLLLLTLGGRMVDYFGELTQRQLGGAAWLSVDTSFIVNQWLGIMVDLGKVVFPILAILMVAGIVSNLLQIGFLFLPEKLMPDLSRLDPMKGFGRIFALANFVHLLFGIIKLTLIGTVAYLCLWNQKETILGLTGLSVPQIASFLPETLLWVCIKIAVALLILALLDYGFQWWKHEQDLRMTSQEIREEMKNMEGNPQMISHRKQVQRQLAMNRLSTEVPKADVVITNPTELAVAIQYNPDEMAAPIVVAKGAGEVAKRIRKLALESNVPIVEKKPLAQALYRDVDVGKPIPSEKYAAVAEVLAYVYQLKGKKIPTPGKK